MRCNTKLLFTTRIGVFFFITLLCSSYLYSQCLPHTIASVDDEVFIYACANDGKPDNYAFKTSDTSSLKKAYILANGSDNIISVQTNPFFNFDGVSQGLFRLWSIVFTDSLIYVPGRDVITIVSRTGCSRLSENVVNVVRDIPKGQDVLFEKGNRDTFVCFDNGVADSLKMAAITDNSAKHIFVVTEFSGAIKDFFKGPYFVPDRLPKNTYLIYDLAYTGNLSLTMNAQIFSTVLASGCYSVGVRPARIDIEDLEVEAMTIITPRRKFCPKDDKPDLFQIDLSSNVKSAISLVLLDANKICTKLVSGELIDLNTEAPGVYTLHAVRYSGELLIKVGDTILSTSGGRYSSDCFVWSPNPVTLNLVIPNAGNLTTSSNDTSVFVCPGDRFPDRVAFKATNHSTLSDYIVVIVNDKNKIVATLDLNSFIDFEAFGLGQCKAYGVAYTGDLIQSADSSLLALRSSDCINITKQSITINKDRARGGSISFAGGATEYFVCDQNLSIRKLAFENKNVSNSPYKYVLTTETGIIVDFVEKDSIKFDGSSVSQMRIYGVAYSGQIVISKFNNLFVSSFSNGCYSISDNFIRVVKTTPFGGGIRLPDGSTKELFCPSEPGPRLLSLRNVANSPNPFSFVLTDNLNKVLDIFPNFSYRFDTLQIGQYFVYGVSYIGNIILKKGDSLTLGTFSDDCFNFSTTPIEVVINEIQGGLLTTTEGSANVFTCPSNLDPDIITMVTVNARSLGYRFVITNEQDVIIGFSSSNEIDFGANPINSRCKVYGVAYKGAFTGVVGRKVNETAYSSSCYDLSDNFINIRKIVPPNHKLNIPVKDSVITLCIGDSQKDTLRFSTSDSLGMKTVYLAVENDKISRIYSNPAIEFERDTPGLTKIYSLIFTGRLLASPGLNFVNGLALSDDCFSLSSNHLLIDKVKSGNFCVIVNTKDESWVDNLKLYPNPIKTASQSLQMEWAVAPAYINKLARIQVYSIDGKKIIGTSLRLQKENLINLEYKTLVPGLYILKIESEGSIVSRKLIVTSE